MTTSATAERSAFPFPVFLTFSTLAHLDLLTTLGESGNLLLMETVEYVYFLSPEQTDRLRVRFHKDKKIILQFVVQYEALLGKEWMAIVRYDTSHGFAHRDLIHPDGSVDKLPLPMITYPLALTYATQDLKQNWFWYRHRYEEEKNQ